MKRVRYPAEFKTEAVKQVTERGHGVVDVAKRQGPLAFEQLRTGS
jgi:transposase